MVVIAGYIIRREVDETPAFAEESAHGEVPGSPIVEAIRLSWDDIVRVLCIALTNVIAVVTAIFGAPTLYSPPTASGSQRASICGFRFWAMYSPYW